MDSEAVLFVFVGRCEKSTATRVFARRTVQPTLVGPRVHSLGNPMALIKVILEWRWHRASLVTIESRTQLSIADVKVLCMLQKY